MGLSFDSLKLEFKEYLINRGVIKEDSDGADKELSVSIFAHKEEFKDFIGEVYDIELDSISTSLSELAELEIKDGKFVLENKVNVADEVTEQSSLTDLTDEPSEQSGLADLTDEVDSSTDVDVALDETAVQVQDENLEVENVTEGVQSSEELLTENSDETPSQITQDAQEIQSENKFSQDNFLVQFLNLLFGDEDFLSKVDDDAQLDNEEIKKFLTYASALNDDEKSLTFDEVLEAYEAVDSNKYDENKILPNESDESINLDDTSTPPVVDEELDKMEDEIEDEQVDEVEETEETKETEKSASSSSSSGGGGGGGGGSPSTSSSTQKVEEKNLNQMNLTELQAEKDKRLNTLQNAQNSVKEAQAQYKDYFNQGKEHLKTSMEELNETDKESVEVALEYQNKVSDKKIEISDSKTKINDFDMQIVGFESNLRVAKAQLSSYQNALGAVSEEDENAASKKSQLQAVINELQNTTIPDLESKITETSQKRDEEKTHLGELEGQLADLESSESEDRQKYEEAKAKLSEEAQALLSEYETFIKDLDAEVSKFETSVNDSQKALLEVEAEIIARNDNKAQRIATANDEFDPNGNGYTWVEMQRKQGVMPYDVIAPVNADPNEELPVLVYMHGSNMDHKTLYNNSFANYNLETWNGYIICVDANDGTWTNDLDAIDGILDDFSSQYKIDPDRISMAGYSLGGSGVISFSSQGKLTDGNGYTYRNAAIITGYNKIHGDYDVPIIMFNDSHNNPYNEAARKNLDTSGDDVYIATGVDHTTVDEKAFTWDANNNGKADIFEFFEGSLKDNS